MHPHSNVLCRLHYMKWWAPCYESPRRGKVCRAKMISMWSCNCASVEIGFLQCVKITSPSKRGRTRSVCENRNPCARKRHMSHKATKRRHPTYKISHTLIADLSGDEEIDHWCEEGPQCPKTKHHLLDKHCVFLPFRGMGGNLEHFERHSTSWSLDVKCGVTVFYD